MFDKENASGILDFYTLLFFVAIFLLAFADYKLSKKKNTKIWYTLFAVSLGAAIYSRIDFEVKEIVIVKEGFVGNVTIFFNESCGENIKFDEDGNRIFQIPDNGVLIVKESNQTRSDHSTYFYKLANNQIVELIRFDESEIDAESDNSEKYNNPKKKKVGIYFRSRGKDMQSFYVCNYYELSDLIDKTQNTRFPDSVLTGCRMEEKLKK